jgi:hypothetical protein
MGTVWPPPGQDLIAEARAPGAAGGNKNGSKFGLTLPGVQKDNQVRLSHMV